MKVKRPYIISRLRLIPPLLIMAVSGALLCLVAELPQAGRVWSAPVSLRVVPPYSAVPSPVTKVQAEPDFDSIPEEEGRIKLQWSAPADGGGLNVFSYIIKYATFSASDLAGNTTQWWNHPYTLTASESDLPPQWGRKSYAAIASTETIVITGLSPGDYYYFAIKSIDRYHRSSGWDNTFDTVFQQAKAFATTPPWQPYIITTLQAWVDVNLKASAYLQWSAPYFVEDKPPYNLVPGHIKQTGYYCIQYSTNIPPDPINRPNQPNNWNDSTRIFISTKDVRTGDIQNYILTGLSHNATYYIHIFTRNEWPNKWSYASYPTVTVRPYITLKPVENLSIYASASPDENIASYAVLSWQTPSDEEFLRGTRIVYSTSSYPPSPDATTTGEGYFDIQPLSSNQTTSYTHIQMLPRTTYYYSVWSYDINRFYSEPRYGSVYTADDLTAPPAVGGISSTITLNQSGPSDLYTIGLSWEIPQSPLYRSIDYKGVKIYYSSRTADTSAHQYLDSKENGGTSFSQTVLEPYVTYYYSFASYDTVGNEQPPERRATHSVYISERYVPPSPPSVITYLYSVSRDYEDGCKISLNWRAPSEPHTSKVIARIGYTDYPQNIYDGEPLGEWAVTPSLESTDGFSRLLSLTTNYISLYAVSSYGIASRPSRIKFFTYIPWEDTIAPFVPRDLRVKGLPDGKIRIAWSAVKYDGTLKAISSESAPRIDELYFYEVLKSTSIRGAWKTVSRTSPSQNYCDITPPAEGDVPLLVKVRATDASRNYADSEVTDTYGNVYIVNVSSAGPEDTDYVLIPSTLAAALRYPDNPDKDIYIPALTRIYSDEKGNIYKSIEFKVMRITDETKDALSLQESTEFSLKGAGAYVAFSYKPPLLNNAISRYTAARKSPAEISKDLGVFYLDGKKWQRINLSLPDADQGFVLSPARFVGKYQLRYAPTTGEFVFYDVMPKTITPNNDGKNDRALFRFSNPQRANLSLKIYDINSALVKNIGETTATSDIQGEYIYWDGTDEKGNTVQPGVYIYQLELDGKIINGTIVVAR